jgi:hypothetical protein
VSAFEPQESGAQALDAVLGELDGSGQKQAAQATRRFFDVLNTSLGQGGMTVDRGHPWCLQEVASCANTISINLVVTGREKAVVNSTVGGGVGFWLEWNGQFSAEVSVYLHRLICTNGMIRQVSAKARCEAATPSDLGAELTRAVPAALNGISTGLEDFGRVFLVRLGILRPVVPVVLDYLRLPDLDRKLILDAFAAEPGDTLGHFVNAFSRAANLVMVAHGIPRETALAKRRRLQSASMTICDTVLDGLTRGRGLLDMRDELRRLLGGAASHGAPAIS